MPSKAPPNIIKSYQTSEEIMMQQQKIMKENPFADMHNNPAVNQIPAQYQYQQNQPTQPSPQKNEDVDMSDANRVTYVKSPSD